MSHSRFCVTGSMSARSVKSTFTMPMACRRNLKTKKLGKDAYTAEAKHLSKYGSHNGRIPERRSEKKKLISTRKSNSTRPKVAVSFST
jgi:hypothetical protein